MSFSPSASSSQSPVVIYRTANPVRAHALTVLLADYGIRAQTIGDYALLAGAECGWRAPAITVTVAAADARIAQGIADAYDRHAHAHDAAEDLLDDSPARWNDWPTCGRCGKPRPTRCPICKSAGDDFPLADPGPVPSDAVMLICGICDEPFLPQFQRDCVWCNHQHRDGIDRCERIVDTEPCDIHLASAIGLMLVLAAAMFYLWYFFRG